MNKHTKTTGRGLSLLLSLLLTLGLLAGCGDSASPSSSQGTASTGSTVLRDTSTPESGTDSASAGEDSSAAAVSTKNITLEVVHKDGSKKEFEISTEEKNLRGALEQEDLIKGEESQYGLYVKTVDGETADEANQEWWCLTKGGEMCDTGVDGVEIADGDAYEFTLTVGY